MQQEERKKSFKKLLGKEESAHRRREHTTHLRKAQRDKVISAKRLKLDEITDVQVMGEEDEGEQLTPEQLAPLVESLSLPQNSKRAEALHQLRKILSSPEPPLDAVVGAGVVPLLLVT